MLVLLTLSLPRGSPLTSKIFWHQTVKSVSIIWYLRKLNGMKLCVICAVYKHIAITARVSSDPDGRDWTNVCMWKVSMYVMNEKAIMSILLAYH